ncbi:threonine--tRNA ligase [Candidatus Neoehrlichia procyonis]|uniref:Threonine--tRNA ligase n=1 Tax=Candidatus Neoehrlichia procyonis str. RAC413 TaxID=1359163 RepID=A0A0F3NMV2_9RICK|nr:threonine--tRNA ligase [Candidatus Neoehrlichia lotoris]KJV69385.1 threonine--tRNA ligase [Candidatus Neoehrlichia lotoris str. RAC413]
MITITSSLCKQTFNVGSTGFDVIASLFPQIKDSIVVLKINDVLCDLSVKIFSNSTVEPITIDSDIGVNIIRKDTMYIMAMAVQEIFHNAKLGTGSITKDGFYYDFAIDHAFSTEDIKLIEKKMLEIISHKGKFIRRVWKKQEAIDFFLSIKESYKVEIVRSELENQDITVYQQGNFVDICSGPHSPSTQSIKAFKLMKISGVYWKGDSNNPMFQRIYGTAWSKSQDLKSYLIYLEEVEKRDHRKIAKELDLFHIQGEAVGQIFWHNKGWTIYRIIEDYIRKKLKNNGYIEVKTPMLINRELWEKSGHWDKFRENMFLSKIDENELSIKPMNCPCHVQIFNSKIQSYRDLPIRMAEFGTCHRYESSGSLHGLMRVRGFTQDDAHIFCTEDQITLETLNFCNLLQEVYKDFGFYDIKVKFSDRPNKKIGSDEIWDKAEKSLKDSIKSANLSYTLNPGEGAFYGPKIEFILKDAIGREWQCGTLQLDFVLPSRLNAVYTGRDGEKHHPVMIHRAILGTFERFIGILIEHYAGKFPVWLSPVQLVILTITNDSENYAQQLKLKAEQHNIRVEVNTTNENINYKVRYYSSKKVPIMWIVGKSEVEQNSVSIRYLGSSNQHTVSIDKALKTLLSYASIS